MKKLMNLSLVLVATALTLSSCNCFKKMAKNSDEVSLTCDPQMLVLNNGVVAADIKATFPVAYFSPKAIVKVTPVMVFEGGEVAGTPKFYQGSKAEGNYTVVDKNSGGTFTQHVEFPWDERMRISELHLRAEVKCKPDAEFVLVDLNSEQAVTAEQIAENPAVVRAAGLKIAEGVNTLQEDLAYSEAMDAMPNDYKRITTEVNQTDIRYAIGSATVTNSALKTADLNAFKADVEEKKANDRATQHIAVRGYASPDGPEKLNDRLAKQRSESGDKVIAKMLKDSGLEIDMAAYGEDWDGFQRLVRESNIQDKEMILQVLSMYTSSTEREEQIKNISSVFGELKKDVLPQLRRAAVVNTTDLEGKSDEEMMAIVRSGKLDQLNINELLHVAESVAPDAATRTIVLEHAATTYNDARAYNNLGIQYMENGQEAEALKAFEKSAQLGGSSTELNNNLALANAANGDLEAAKQYAQGADAKTRSLIAAAEGNYNEAARQTEGRNAAIANTMNKDYAAAKRAISSDTSADADYLRAVIASEEGDLRTAESQLKSAVAKNADLAKKAAKDIHFKQLFLNGLQF